MQLNQTLLPELQHEAGSTRKMLERIPAEKFSFQPHAKSMAMGKLAIHIADLIGWIAVTLQQPELDLMTLNYQAIPPSTTDELVQRFDENLAKATAALQEATNEQLMTPWTLRRGDHVIMTLPRIAILRSMVFSHIIHHRGQLSVYLRLNDIPVPGMYGPSMDEKEAMAAATA